MESLSGEFWPGTAAWPCLLLTRQGAEKRKPPCSHTLKLTKMLFDKHGTFLQCLPQKLSPFQTRGRRYDGCRNMTSIKCCVMCVQGPTQGLGMETALSPAWPGSLSVTREQSMNSGPKCIITKPIGLNAHSHHGQFNYHTDQNQSHRNCFEHV